MGPESTASGVLMLCQVDVERCIPKSAKRFRDTGWTTDARPWMSVELSASAVSTGVITIPSSFSRFIKGRYLIQTQDGSMMGTMVVADTAGWGLRPFFVRRGGEQGDLLLTYIQSPAPRGFRPARHGQGCLHRRTRRPRTGRESRVGPNFVNTLLLFLSSSGINNQSRALLWLAGYFETLVRVRHLIV